jgi:hypothetical protein
MIINSAAYVISEFRTEFGAIPPCMLPIANHQLIEYQIPLLKKLSSKDKIIVSLPDNFKLNINENRLLEKLGAEVVFVPVDFALAESILYVLNVVDGWENSSLKLLHGDTLAKILPNGDDIIGTTTITDDYNWEKEEVNIIWGGYFSFSSPKFFVKCLAISRGDFVGSVRMYAKQNKMSLADIKDWHDLGHINTYFVSRSNLTTQRVFNDLKIYNGEVLKSSTQTTKIEAEINWFMKIPRDLRKYTPKLIDFGINPGTKLPFYSLEYLPFSPLNEIFVHGRNPDFYWKKIFNLIGDFLSEARKKHDLDDEPYEKKIFADTMELYEIKTRDRIKEYIKNSHIMFDVEFKFNGITFKSLNHIIDDCIKMVKSLPVIISVLHGDLCFSNILFDSRIDRIKLIDPRGLNQQKEKTIFGDQKYDLAKLAHSAIGLYDFIIAGRFRIINDEKSGYAIEFDIDERLLNIQNIFLNTKFLPSVSVYDNMPLVVLLFFSMLPLHFDNPDRQKAMLLNAVRMYTLYCMQKE